MKKHCLDLRIVSATHVSDHHVLLKLTHDQTLPDMIPGQFVELRIDNSPSTFLRRPISINFVDYDHNELWLLVAGIGDGTRHLCQLHEGDMVNCLLPLGNGFSQLSHKKVLLVGGGVGVAPLLLQGYKLKQEGSEPSFLLGARSAKDLLELDLFREIGPVYITTEDESEGEKGFVTNHSILQREKFDFIQTCGPKPMMKAVAKYAKANGITCEASLENMMACGLGACLCCVEKTVEGNLRVCEDGPVFNIDKLLW
jgi:dihydroorotate dehydrogenase electron transfer subunit